MLGNVLLKVMELIGTVAFSVSGSLVAIGCSLDLFGAIIVGCFTAVGGGMIRDLLIGNTPPAVFFSPETLLLSLVTSLAVFILSYVNSKRFKGMRKKIENINVVFDAVGLAVFSVVGVEVAMTSGFSDNGVLAVTLGVITGVGGGIIRDVLVNEKPYVLTRHIYAVASIVGCTVYYFVRGYMSLTVIGTVAAIALIVVIRLLAAKFRWKLPKIRLDDENK